MREDLYVRRYEAKAQTCKQKPSALPHQEYKNNLEVLYREILRFQATSYCYYSSNDAFRLGRDVVKWDDWDKLLGQIHNQERRFAAIEALWRDSRYDEECSEVKKRHQESLHKLGEISTDLSSMRGAQIEKNRQELLDWLSDVDPSEIYNTARDKHGAGTGEWLTMESEEFKAWKESPPSLLWLRGKGTSTIGSIYVHSQDSKYRSTNSL
jgi:hypothetical protein